MTVSVAARQSFRILIIILFCAMSYCTAFGASSPAVPLSVVMSSLPLRPHIDALEDPHGQLTIEQVASAAYIQKFTPLAFRNVSGGTAASWLRLTLEADKTGRLSEEMLYPVLDLGSAQPGGVQLFVPHYADESSAWPTGWQSLSAAGPAQFPLPVPPDGTVTCYVRIAGPTGLWFYPSLQLRKASAPLRHAPSYMEGITGLVAGLVMLNFLMFAMGRGESRFWLGLYGGLMLLHSASGPPPAPAGGLPFSSAWAFLTPGLALVLLPHVGRHILNTWDKKPSVDATLRGLSVFGAVLAVAPLIPGCSSLVRLLPLWPVLALPTAIPALQCSHAKLPGAKRYLLACLITASGAFTVFAPVSSPESARLAAMIPFAGAALGLLILTPLVSLPLVKRSPDTSRQTPPTQKNAPGAASQELVARVSHDLRTPLHAICNAAETLSLAPLDADAMKKVRTMQAAAGNLSTLINDLLDANRISKGRMHLKQRPFDLQHILVEAHDIILPLAEQKGLNLSWYMEPHLHVKYSGDADRLLQVLLNLLGNAVRFSDRGTVSFKVSRVPESTNAGYLLFTIKDNGISIPLQNQYAVFEEFCLSPDSGTGRYSGSGLGLTIARDLIGLMGGHICLQSSPSHGTEVSFTVRLLPLPGDVQIASMAREDEFSAYSPFSKPPKPQANRILVADDVASNRQLVRFFLEGLPYVLEEARTGEEAIERYQNQPYGMVLIDADMPGLGGTHAVQAIRTIESQQGLSAAPILALAARPEESARMLEAGCTATLLKPLSRMRLLEVVTRLAPPATAAEETDDSLVTGHTTIERIGVAPQKKAAPAEALHQNTVLYHSDAETGSDRLPQEEQTLPAALLQKPVPAPAPAPPPSPAPEPEIAVRTEGDMPTLDSSLLPLVPGLLESIDEALADAHRSVRNGSPLGVQEAAGRLAGTASSFGLRVLERMARCVERAALADDLDAILNLLPELENMAQRNNRALTDIYRMHKAMSASEDRNIR
ncbi:ATP-binding protein [Desulfovibrio mangrovi]|uniref:ATP-binding protein n=1 Tax=Desulfovibrio mangrovi TaxID=2976983 RepID=UPI00224598B5|nr:ATP-binding protein [Desulfovibrio mangrovi]UZP67389.1 ATP-binding protein [Desulfovibrio mangrovi]